MIRLARSAAIPPFTTPPSTTIYEMRQEVRLAAQEGRSFDFQRHAEWGETDVVRCFETAQHHKCAYCECPLDSSCAQIDHFAPKSAVTELFDDGVELTVLRNVRDRTIYPISSSGYWWLAYEWSNFVLSCERCNVGWKRTLFPVAPPRPVPPSPEREETRLLINPYDEDPEPHLKFGSIGEVSGVGQKGKETVKTLGLNRPSRQLARKTVWGDMVQDFKNFCEGSTSACDSLISRCEPDRPYAATARAALVFTCNERFRQTFARWDEVLRWLGI